MRRGHGATTYRALTTSHGEQRRLHGAKRRLLVLAAFVLLVPVLLGLRLFDLQLVQADELRLHRTQNLHGVEWLHAKRGRILDARDHVLVEDEAQFVLRFVYRDFRRGHVCGLLVHLDRFLRDLQAVTSEVPAGLVDGEPLRFVDTPLRFVEACRAVLGLRIAALQRDGPLGKRLRSVLRFYVFEVCDELPSLRACALTAERALAGIDDEPSARRVGASLARAILATLVEGGEAREDAVEARISILADEVDDLVEARHADLRELASLVSDRLILPGMTTQVAARGKGEPGWVSQYGELFEWLDACDRLHDRRTTKRLEALHAKRSEVLPGFWTRILDAFHARDGGPQLSRRLADALTAGTKGSRHASAFEERLALRFRSEYGPVLVEKAVDFENVVAVVLGRRERFPGFEVGEELRRSYPTRAHDDQPYRFLGITQWRGLDDDDAAPTLVLGDELDSDIDAARRLHLADDEREIWQARVRSRLLREFQVREGVNNLELYLDPVLTGQAGFRALLRDRAGKERFSPSYVAARRGHDVRLTIDHEVQDLVGDALREAAAALATKEGRELTSVKASFVLIDAVSGAVHAMNWLPTSWYSEALDVDIPDRANPTCIHRWQPSTGSVLKPIFAVEGLVRGLVEGHDFEVCAGHYGRTWNRVSCDCRNRWKPQSLRKALSHSCNSYFGQLGGRLGFEGLQAGLLRFGLITGSDERMAVPGLRIDASGLVPGERRSLNQRSIGYGFRVPPILLARAYAGIGTGRLPALHIIDSVDGKAIERDPATPLDVDSSVLDAVRVGLVDVPLADGTARRAGLGSDRVAAKTGTAEVLGKAANNASFAGYLPHDAPRLAFCVTFWECPPGIHGGDYPAQALAHFLRALDQRPALRERLFGRVGR